MVKFVKGALLAGVVSLSLTGVASATHDPNITPAEYKCQAAVNKAGSKFVGSKAKCVMKCLSGFWKSLNPESDCLPPYGGTTAQCINDTVLFLKGAENKYAAAIKKACDPATKIGTECPSCYNTIGGLVGCGDAGYAGAHVQDIEGQVDSFVPGVGCERAGADPAEQKCQLGTAKTLSKLVGSVNKCYDKCIGNAHKGIGTEAACLPSASEPLTVACINKADTKAIAGVDKACSQVIPNANPDCGAACVGGGNAGNPCTVPANCPSGTCTIGAPGAIPDTYPSGAQWVNLVELAISGTVPATYCDSPSGAFIE